MRFEGKVVLVTGAASGIGRAASLQFALDGGRTPYVLTAPLSDDLAEALDRLG